MQLFIDEFAQAYATSFNILLLDNPGAQVAKGLKLPSNVGLVFLPAASPELNPAERVWQDLKAPLAWLIFTDLEALQQEVVERLCAYDAPTLQSLTSYPYLLDAIHVVSS